MDYKVIITERAEELLEYFMNWSSIEIKCNKMPQKQWIATNG